MSKFLDELYASARTTTKGLVVGFPDNPRVLGWGEIYEQGKRISGGLAAQGVAKHDSVAILAGEPADIAPTLQGVWMRGASVTMLHQPTPRTDLEKWAADTVRTLLVIDAQMVVVGAPFEAAIPVLEAQGISVATMADLATFEGADPIPTDEDDAALLQLTSGSTGDPKAVVITHRNLFQNRLSMAESSAIDPSTDVMVSWLPLFHDMGMVGFLIGPMQTGTAAVCATPLDFLKRPLMWAEMITKYGGTMTAAPNFAYAILGRRLASAPDGAYDLSTLRFVLNGAEPIDTGSLNEFIEQAARFGLEPSAMIPAYGMAEATLAVSFTQLGRGITIDQVDPAALEAQNTAINSQDPGARKLARLGPPMPGLELRVVSDTGETLPARHVGEFILRGEALARWYATAEGRVRAVNDDGWFETGDLGYLTDEGEVVVCGRKKDLIIVAGRNIFPTDIERSSVTVEGTRAGGVVAVSISAQQGREEFGIIAESAHAGDPGESERIRKGIANVVHADLGISPKLVKIVEVGVIPKTPSGKPKRAESVHLVAP